MSSGVAESASTDVRTIAGEGIVAEVRLDHEDLLLRTTLRRSADAIVDPEYVTTTESGRELFFFTVRADAYDSFETALSLDRTVRDPVLVDRFDDRRVYRVELADCAIPLFPTTARFDARVIEVTGDSEGWLVRLRLPDRDSLLAFSEFCQENDITFSVNHLRKATESADPVVGLTPKQQELLSVAYREGYFSVPRGISQTELADRLGVSKSAISQRLRRAIGELCGSTLPVDS